MSRSYNMYVQVEGFDQAKIDGIKEAADAEWDFDDCDWFLNKEKTALSASNDGSLYGGESEDEFSERLAAAVFKANGSPCKILVAATYLEDLPCESHSFDEKDYDRLLGKK